MGRLKLTCDYALYQGDDIIMIGSRQELAAYLQVTERTVYYSTETYRRKLQGHQVRGRRRMVVLLDA